MGKSGNDTFASAIGIRNVPADMHDAWEYCPDYTDADSPDAGSVVWHIFTCDMFLLSVRTGIFRKSVVSFYSIHILQFVFMASGNFC